MTPGFQGHSAKLRKDFNMGLMPAGARNPFTKMDRQSVIGALKATGSRDPDILYSQKTELLSLAKQLKLCGIICMGGGVFFTLTVILAIFGIPIGIFGWWCWSFGKRNIAAVEAGYAEYIGSSAASAASSAG
jgi:hypothetical protein